MAVTDKHGSKPSQSPAWLTVLFFAGAICLYLGRRVIVQWETASLALAVLGVAAMLGSTVLRLSPMFRGRSQNAEIARMMDGLQLLGLVAIGLFFATTDRGIEMLSLGDASGQHVVTAFEVAWITLLTVSGVGLVFAEVALRPMRDAAHLEGKRVRAAAVGGISLALAACYCSLLVYAAAQQEAQADFSYFKTSEPGDATVKLVQKAAEPIVVTAFFPKVSEVRKEVQGYFSKLSERAGNLEFKVVDRLLEPRLAEQLRVVADGSIVLSRGESKQSMTLGTKLPRARQKLVKFDGEFYAKLTKLLKSRRTVYLTTGHGELNESASDDERAQGRSADLVKRLLERGNYRVRDLGLSDGLARAVPDDADVVVVLGPTRPFAPEEIATLKRYADGGGKLLMALDTDAIVTTEAVTSAAAPLPSATGSAAPTAPTTPTAREEAATPEGDAPAPSAAQADTGWLEELAAIVDMKFVPTVLADERNHVVARNDPSDRAILPTNRFSSHASVTTLTRSGAQAGVIVLGASYLTAVEGGASKATPTLRSLPTAFNDDNRDFSMSPGEARKSFNLAMALERDLPAEPEPAPEAARADAGAAAEEEPAEPEKEPMPGDVEQEGKRLRAFVVADADVFSDLLLSRAIGNQMLIVDAMRWLVGEESLAGELENEEDVTIEQTKQEDLAWFYSTIFGVPALVLGGGLWTNRRLKRSRTAQRPKPPSNDASSRDPKEESESTDSEGGAA